MNKRPEVAAVVEDTRVGVVGIADMEVDILEVLANGAASGEGGPY